MVQVISYWQEIVRKRKLPRLLGRRRGRSADRASKSKRGTIRARNAAMRSGTVSIDKHDCDAVADKKGQAESGRREEKTR